MDTRYFSQKECKVYYCKDFLEQDIVERNNIGISATTEILLSVEKMKKSDGLLSQLRDYISKVEDLENDGYVIFLELNAESITENIEDEIFYDAYLDKRANPFKLATIFTLRTRTNSYWSETVLQDALNFYE